MDLKTLLNWGGEIVFCLCGLVSFNAAGRGLQNEKCRIGTFVFWTILGLIFILGPYIPYALTGALLLVLGCLTATRQVQIGKFVSVEPSFRKAQADKLGNTIFLPAITIGAASLLPQLLGALGSVFTEAGVGTVISSIMANVVPQGSVVLGVIVYVTGMVLFTMVMGNAFAAFSVITVGIGVPFVILQGGDPAIVGALGMTAGFCGTLMTPMAANFNIVPAAVLETKNKYTVIKAQLPMALVMIVVHVVLMLVLAF